MLKTYLQSLTKTALQGDDREESYYTHLESLLYNYAEKYFKRKIHVTILPKQTEAGNPDFRIWDGQQHVTGYIEAKAPTTSNLDYIENSEQLLRYISTFPNVILTNFYEFRLYRDGQKIDSVQIARPFITQKLRTIPPVENEEAFISLLDKYFSFSLPRTYTARTLAIELAKRTRFLRDEVLEIELIEKDSEGHKKIFGFYDAFKKYLIANLTEKQFADLYAQTVTYGLFAARTRATNGFNRELAFKYIPKTIGILHDVFKFISLEDPPEALRIIVDDIAEVLHVADLKKILADKFFDDGIRKDPVMHFYETFLAQYDPEVRERRGVYYTPDPIVLYITRSVHKLLKDKFNKPDGLANEGVTLLDPAAGTLTFPSHALQIALTEFSTKYGSGGKTKFIKNHILKNFYAFELMMAPYAVGHLKISLMLEEYGYTMADDERFKFYLTNALEMEELEQIQIPGLSSLSEESQMAGKVKKDKPILVITGNPPYSGISLNPGERKVEFNAGDNYVSQYIWDNNKQEVLKKYIKATKKLKTSQKTFIGDILMDYYFVDNKRLDEKKLWLQDDYVKFLRFAQWKIQKAGSGIVGMITNHSYLDNPTFRGMRQSLMRTFNEIYILDLHGNSLKKETCPDGSKDENVFDIRQGVAIVLFLKTGKAEKCNVFHTERFGLREEKYNWLTENGFLNKSYKQIKPTSPWYFFIPRDTEKIKEYLNWHKITEIFPINNVGIVTARDRFAIDFNKNTLKNRIRQFRDLKVDDSILKEAYKLKDTSTFKLSKFRKELSKIENWEDSFEMINYRPFDIRHIYYSKWVIERPTYETMRHIMEPNIGLLVCRQQNKLGFMHSFITDKIAESCVVSNKTREINYLFPLYLYNKTNEKKRPGSNFTFVFEPEVEYQKRKPNISEKIFNLLDGYYGTQPAPEEIFYYIYGILYSPVYRTRYAEFLKIDFPRIPFTKDHDLFIKIGKLGKRLADLHLLNSKELDPPVAKYQGEGDNDIIDKPVYNEDTQRLYINKEKYFEGVKSQVWNYFIGGYKVIEKYIKSRKGKSMEDPVKLCKIITAIERTIELQEEIDYYYKYIKTE